MKPRNLEAAPIKPPAIDAERSRARWVQGLFALALRVIPSAGVRSTIVVLASTVVMSSACSNANSTPRETEFGSETNFLRYCADDECGDGLICNCGVCTRACEDADQCADLADNAVCVALPIGSEQETASCKAQTTCDVACTSNTDCAALNGDYSCQAGVCRAGEQQCGATSLPAGDFTRQLTIDGVQRAFNVHVPETYAGTNPAPLVLDFHAMGMSAEWERNNSGYLELSEQEGFIVVWPVGLDNTWNVGPCCGTDSVDEFAFVTTLVKAISTGA